MVMNKLLRFGKRQLQTVASRDIIKPSSPTPSHLKTYDLSLLDQIAMNAYMPIVLFYQNFGHENKYLELKNSLSQTLSQYYPFAGRLAKNSPGPTYVDCNDEGVEFIEAYKDCELSNFLKHSQQEDLDQFFPDNLIWYNSNRNDEKNRTSARPLTVQVSRFACGGVAIAASLSHKIADACTMLHFFNHWGTMTRSPKDATYINPHIISHQTRNIILPKELSLRKQHGDYVTRNFIFPNTKLNNLKRDVESMTAKAQQPIMNLTRVEALTWLLQNRLVAASKTFKAKGVCQLMSMRNTLADTLPMTTVGNLFLMTDFPTRDQSDLVPDRFIGELRKAKMDFRRVSNLETAIEVVAGRCCDEAAMMETVERLDGYYLYTNLYGLPAYEIDFGWGKPVKMSVAGALKNVIVLMDTPNREGIEVLVSLERQDMEMVLKDPELLALC